MIVGKKVRLVPLDTEKHLDYIMEHFNNPQMRVYLGGYIPVSRNAEREWIEAAEESLKKRTDFHFAIETHPDGNMIGTLGLHDVDWLSRSCVLGIAIYEEQNWSKGYGTESIQLLLDFGWAHLNMRRIELGVHDHNPRARHVYEKIGFKHYGTAHQKYYIDGRYVDTHYMEILREQTAS